MGKLLFSSPFLSCVDTGLCTCEHMNTHLLAHAHTKSGACWVELKPLNVSERRVIPKIE